MRRRQQVFLSANRIFLLLYIPLNIALAVYYLFTGSLWHSVLALFTLVWIALPSVLFKYTSLRPAHLMLLQYYLLIIFGYSGGVVLSFGTHFWGYDELIHMYSGFFFCMLAAGLFCYFTKKRAGQMNRRFCYVFCISFSLAVFLLWESVRLIYDVAIRKLMVTLSMIAADGIAWSLGIVLLMVFFVLKDKKQIHVYPLYAFEDFAYVNVKSTIEILN